MFDYGNLPQAFFFMIEALFGATADFTQDTNLLN